MNKAEVVAEPFKVCPDCPIPTQLRPFERRRKCYGKREEALGQVACGKKSKGHPAREVFPEIWKFDD